MRTILALAFLAVVLAGCETAHEATWAADVETTASIGGRPEPEDVKYYASDEMVRAAQTHFNHGDFGSAERYFRQAADVAPKDVTAWIGLAACYDRLARFDLADQAYRRAVALSGETVEILNNQGFSYMLRGNLNQARAKFKKALARDPGNATVLNNLELLNGSYRFITREASGDN